MRFKYLDFVVTGCPRSGTRYAARALKSLGFACEHEACFNPWSITFAAERPDDEVWGDSSWLSVPFLPWLPAETKIVHLVRDPLRTINSMLGTGQLGWPNDYRRFLFHHAHGDEAHWPEDLTAFTQQFWTEWNERIETTARVSLRVQIEEFANAVPALVSILQPGRVLSDQDLHRLAQIPQNENSRPYEGQIRVEDIQLSQSVRHLAGTYGYHY